ncbi:Transcription factor [Penicillium vulpinum]|uniref:Transcription factor n=1 Tax=Penicillium vulpinum TaxID=29845 RepID=UPI0025486228|nr:Transcription factor [Penicillium vulpinum]KAJ5964988.1 Transcription factor [Penicillium vulpinum]
MNRRLGYVSMPLVLAAINLKLSPSRKEMEARQRRLNSLIQVIRHSETLYDVADFVAIGTNHILQLAYTTTQNLFLEEKPPQSYSSDNMRRDKILSSTRRSTRASFKPNRPTSWQDAFIQCPRAYLLISTSVDYNLSIGRLPSVGDLPRIVRELPAIGVIERLPWPSDILPSESLRPLENHVNHLQQQQRFSPRVHLSLLEWRAALEPRTPETELEKTLSPQTAQINYNSSPDTFSDYPATLSFIMDDQQQYINRVAAQTTYGNTAPNLNFMDLRGCRSVSNSAAETCARRIPLEIVGQDLQTESLLKQPVFDTHAATLTHPVKGIPSTIFDSFFHEAFGQNWAV